MSLRFRHVVVFGALLSSVACSQTSSPTAASVVSRNPITQFSKGGGGGGGGTVKETLSGPPINGVTPSGLATADQSQFSSGGSTILTVQVSNVNLPDGTVLGVTLDFTPVGSIVLSGGRGSTQKNLGHFAVSNDDVRVNNGNTQILIGGFFR
jgi:hypothetical protein